MFERSSFLLSLLSFFLLPHIPAFPVPRTATGGEVTGAGRLRGGEERAEVGARSGLVNLQRIKTYRRNMLNEAQPFH